ncbi:serine-rich adhesin for platelets-like [Littorina saxatilis]|uniref:Uncharacterized protein n=1 Tax=Littorina saxatilis TaxID=31220 RepID=A0AAN9AQK3_9CAEN
MALLRSLKTTLTNLQFIFRKRRRSSSSSIAGGQDGSENNPSGQGQSQDVSTPQSHRRRQSSDVDHQRQSPPASSRPSRRKERDREAQVRKRSRKRKNNEDQRAIEEYGKSTDDEDPVRVSAERQKPCRYRSASRERNGVQNKSRYYNSSSDAPDTDSEEEDLGVSLCQCPSHSPFGTSHHLHEQSHVLAEEFYGDRDGTIVSSDLNQEHNTVGIPSTSQQTEGESAGVSNEANRLSEECKAQDSTSPTINPSYGTATVQRTTDTGSGTVSSSRDQDTRKDLSRSLTAGCNTDVGHSIVDTDLSVDPARSTDTGGRSSCSLEEQMEDLVNKLQTRGALNTTRRRSRSRSRRSRARQAGNERSGGGVDLNNTTSLVRSFPLRETDSDDSNTESHTSLCNFQTPFLSFAQQTTPPRSNDQSNSSFYSATEASSNRATPQTSATNHGEEGDLEDEEEEEEEGELVEREQLVDGDATHSNGGGNVDSLDSTLEQAQELASYGPEDFVLDLLLAMCRGTWSDIL